MAQPNIQGRFFWQELLSPDPAAVTAFYGKVLGWRAQPAASDPSYITFASRSGLVAGAMALGAEKKETPSHWLPYIGAENVDATLANAVRLGAKLVQAAADIEQGRYAVLTDPQGASFGVYKPKQVAANHTAQPGDHCWLELATSDLETAFKFYQEVFGWQVIQRLDMGAMGTYLIFGVAGTQRGGIMKLSHPAPGPYWLCYTEVADLDKAIAATQKSGGRLLNGPMPVPGGARIAQLADPNGAVFAIHTQAKLEIPASATTASTSSSSASPAKSPATASPAPPPTAAPKAPPAKVPTLEPAKAAAPKPAPAAPAVAPPAPPKVASKPAAKKVPAKKAAAPKKKAAAKKSKPKKQPKKKVAAKKAAAKKKVARKKVAKKKVAKKAKRSASRASKHARRKTGKARRKK